MLGGHDNDDDDGGYETCLTRSSFFVTALPCRCILGGMDGIGVDEVFLKSSQVEQIRVAQSAFLP